MCVRRHDFRLVCALVWIAVILGACRPPTPASSRVLRDDGTAVEEEPAFEALGTHPMNAGFEDRIRLIAASTPEPVSLGKTVAVTALFKIERVLDDMPKIFVHGAVPGGELHSTSADHLPLRGAIPVKDWRVGDVLVDTFRLRVPKRYPADALDVWVGFYEPKKKRGGRWRVTDGEHDGRNRVRIATVQVDDGPPAFPTVTAPERQGEIVIDGKLDEPDWKLASKVGPFIAYDGHSAIRNSTFARLLWDKDYLYLAFECVDADAHTPYKKRDDPLYDSEAVEIFIDADGDKDEYVELQAAPNDLHFDAAFKGGRRKNFDTSYDVNYVTKTVIRGTLNDNSDVDQGWVSEWKIPIAELRDVPGPVQEGTRWKINLFRLDRIRRGDKVIRSEASAWSSPFSGDFHNLDRFGTLVFGPKNPPPDLP